VLGRLPQFAEARLEVAAQGYEGMTPYLGCTTGRSFFFLCSGSRYARFARDSFARIRRVLTFQQLIQQLNAFWGKQGCALLQPYDMEVGAGTFHTATFLRASARAVERGLRAAFAPAEGRALWRQPEPAAALLPVPGGAQALARRHPGSLPRVAARSRHRPAEHDIRFVEDDWESPTLGAWGLGWEVWLDGMEVTQFTYFQEVGGLACKPVLGEITYGLERWRCTCRQGQRLRPGLDPGVTYRDVYHQNEVEQSRYNFELSNATCCSLIHDYEGEGEAPDRRAVRAARLRDGDEGFAHFQPARRARRDLGDRAPGVHWPVRDLAKSVPRRITSRASASASR
jgi:glycyl-tRNA synthetase alpha chain